MAIVLERLLAYGFSVHKLKRFLKSWRYWGSCLRFIARGDLDISFWQRCSLIYNLYVITLSFDDIPHYQLQILRFVEAILLAPRVTDGVVIEAGCFRGVSTAKFSLAAELAGKTLVVLDSFEGIPPNQEEHATYGRSVSFEKGDYSASLHEVQENIRKYGDINSCRFVKGWYDDTLPGFTDPVSAIYLDVDLVSSTKTCLKYLWPKLEPGGQVYSQDGHLTRIVELFSDDDFWRNELDCEPPVIYRLRREQLLVAVKPA